MSQKIVFSCFCILVLFSSMAKAFNLPMILSQYPEYSTFHDLLNKTGLYNDMRMRETTTVLVVQNKAMGDVPSRPLDVLKRILSTHIMLDYFDVPKIVQMSQKSTMVTNMYQSSGIANNNQGFLNITATPDKKIGFGSAVVGSPIDVKLEKLVMSRPYNISVLQVSGVIYTPGIDGTLAAPPRKAVSPTPPAKKNATSSVSPAPSADDNDDDYNNMIAPEASTPAEAPVDAAPAESPKAETPEADKEPADASPPTKSSGMSLASGLLSGFVLTLVSSLAAF